NSGTAAIIRSQIIGNTGDSTGGVQNGRFSDDHPTLTMVDSIVAENRGLSVGGILSFGGLLDISNSAIIANSSIFGGTTALAAGGTVSLTNSTVALNTPGNVIVGNGLKLLSVTVADNNGGPCCGPAVFGVRVTIQNSIIARNNTLDVDCGFGFG